MGNSCASPKSPKKRNWVQSKNTKARVSATPFGISVEYNFSLTASPATPLPINDAYYDSTPNNQPYNKSSNHNNNITITPNLNSNSNKLHAPANSSKYRSTVSSFFTKIQINSTSSATGFPSHSPNSSQSPSKLTTAILTTTHLSPEKQLIKNSFFSSTSPTTATPRHHPTSSLDHFGSPRSSSQQKQIQQLQQQQLMQSKHDPVQSYLRKQLLAAVKDHQANSSSATTTATITTDTQLNQTTLKGCSLLAQINNSVNSNAATMIQNAILPFGGPTKNAVFDAFYLAYSLHEDLVVNVSSIWSQVITTLKNFYKRNGIKTPSLFATDSSAANRKSQGIISTKRVIEQQNEQQLKSSKQQQKDKGNNEQEQQKQQQQPNPKSQDISVREDGFVSWDELVSLMRMKGSEHFADARTDSLEKQTNAIYAKYLLMDSFASKKSLENLSYAIFPGHSYYIRNLVIRGSLSEWFDLRNRIIALGEVAPEFWIDRILTIVLQIILTLQGSLDRSFWDSAFITHSTSSTSLRKSPDEYLMKFGWVKDLFMIEPEQKRFKGNSTKILYFSDIAASPTLAHSYTLQNIYEHRVDIDLTLEATMEDVSIPANLPNAYEPLIALSLFSSKLTQ